MKDLIVSVRKLTDEGLMREACESTFLGKSRASLLDLYKAEHSPVRTQLFWVTLKNIKLFISTHLIRHHVGSIPFQLICRDDLKGGSPDVVTRCTSINNQLREIQSLLQSGQNEMANSLINRCVEDIDWLAENSDRNTPVNLSLLVNAQSLIDMAKLRLCTQAHRETVEVFKKIKSEIEKIDPALASMMVRKCVYRGGLCGEQRCCGFNRSSAFVKEMAAYTDNFTPAQRGLVNFDRLV